MPSPTPFLLLSVRKMERYTHRNSTFVILKISVAATVQAELALEMVFHTAEPTAQTLQNGPFKTNKVHYLS